MILEELNNIKLFTADRAQMTTLDNLKMSLSTFSHMVQTTTTPEVAAELSGVRMRIADARFIMKINDPNLDFVNRKPFD